MPNISAAILAGGQNSRIGGRNKALLSIGEQTVFQKQIGHLSPFFKNIFVVTNHPEDFPGVETTADIFFSAGPLAGIHAGLSFCKTPYLFVFSCDLPFLAEPLIGMMIKDLEGNPCELLIPVHHHKIEPLHAIYSNLLLPQIEEMLQQKTHRIRELIPRCHARYFEVPETIDTEIAFFNINDPTDLTNAESYAKRIE